MRSVLVLKIFFCFDISWICLVVNPYNFRIVPISILLCRVPTMDVTIFMRTRVIPTYGLTLHISVFKGDLFISIRFNTRYRSRFCRVKFRIVLALQCIFLYEYFVQRNFVLNSKILSNIFSIS